METYLPTTRSKKHQTTSAKDFIFIKVVLNVFCVINMLVMLVSTYIILIQCIPSSEENTDKKKEVSDNHDNVVHV
jgi:hypothetical protein